MWYAIDNDKQHLNLIVPGIFALFDLSVSSKIMINKARSHISIWF